MNHRMKRLSLVVVVLAGIGLWRAPQALADSEAAARKHATKANQLAAKNKCKLAIPWFNRAYRTLKDPTLLFNRAECLRKLGENNDALTDFELFLSEVPKAPNRAMVESRIAVLKEAIKVSANAGTSATVSSDAPVAAAKEPAAAAMLVDRASAAPSKTSPSGGGKDTASAPPATETTPAASKPAGKAPVEPIRRAEKWTD